MSKFVGRQAELNRLVETTRKKSASFVIVKGRRRVGKSRLIQEFAKQFDHYYVFAGLPPEKNTTAEHQLEEFSARSPGNFTLLRLSIRIGAMPYGPWPNACSRARYCYSSMKSLGWDLKIRHFLEKYKTAGISD